MKLKPGISGPLRVLVIGRFSSIHTFRFSEELQRQGLDVAALWIGPAKSRPNVRIYHAERSMRLCGVPRTAIFRSLLFVRRAISDFSPDIIHIQDEARFPQWLNLVCPPNILRAYTSWGHNPGLKNVSSFRRGLAKMDLLTSDAPDVLDEITSLAPRASHEIVRFGADLDLFHPGPPDDTILAQYRLDPNGMYVISPRSLRPIYNQLTLIRALPPVVERFPNLQLILKHHHVENYGDSSDYETQVRNEAKRLKLWDRVVRVDHIPYSHQCHLYRLCRAAVSIPLEDAFPSTIFEAMASGCPLVVSNDRSYEGVIMDGTNSVSISPTDTAALSRALLRILSDSDFAEALRTNALETVTEKGDFKKEIKRLIRTYQVLSS